MTDFSVDISTGNGRSLNPIFGFMKSHGEMAFEFRTVSQYSRNSPIVSNRETTYAWLPVRYFYRRENS
jgi:hypothetical protein